MLHFANPLVVARVKSGSRRTGRLLLVFLLFAVTRSQAGATIATTTATATTLSISPGTSVTVGTPITLQATVDAGGTPVTLGTVTFYDGTSVLAAVQVVGKGVAYTHGTANFKLYLGPGTHNVKAVYGGTSLYAPSISSTATIAVVLASPTATTTTISATNSPGNYTLAGKVTTGSSIAATGTVSFLDQTNSNFVLGSAALSAASQINSWPIITTQRTAGSTYGVIVADLNGDGIPDLVTTNYGGTTISVLLGNGDGTFQTHVDYAVGTFSFGLTAGDLNGDGIPDIAVASGMTNFVTVFLGNGDGTLQAGQAYDTRGVAEYVVMADFNNDGILDLATCSASVGSVSVLLGNGDGTFAAQHTFGVSVFPDGLAVGDFNHDGNFDLVVSNSSVNTLSIFLGKGDGTFQVQTDYPTGPSPTNIAVVDLNADGNPDLVVCNSVGFNISVLLGNGDGTFQAKVDYSGLNGPWGVVAADVNGDGIPDMVVTSPATRAVEVFQGKGDGTLLAPVSTPTGSSNYLLALGDWNGNGVIDLAVPDISTSTVSVSLGSVSATATLAGVSVPGGGPHNVVAGYAGDTNSVPSVSAPISLTGTPFVTTVALSVAPTSGSPGQTFVLTADISPSSSSGFTAGGTVTFFDGGVVLGSPVNVVSGSAMLSSNTFTSGTHSITATYSGDANFTGGTTASPTVITVSTPQTITFPAPGPVTYGVAPLTLSATASSGLTVTFSVVSGPATVSGTTLTILSAGSVVVQADQAGDATHTAAVPVQRTLTVNKATSTLALSASAASVNLNSNVTFTATVASGSLPAPTGIVTFFDGSTQLAPVPVNASGVATYSTTSLAAGTHSITATYAGDANFTPSSSSPAVIAVITSQTITFPALSPVTYGVAPITLSATASSGLPVTFSLVSGQATLVGTTLTILAAGGVVIQADQAGDAAHPPAPAVRRTLFVNRAPSVVALVASAANARPNTSLTFTATVSAGNLPTPTGNVIFLDRTQQLATAALNGAGVATYTTSSLTVGSHFIVAYYSGDANFLLATNSLIQTVVGPGYSVTPNPAALTVKLGQIATSTITITPVGGFQGQVSLTCGGAPQIATCSLAPVTVVLPGDDLPHTVQFTLKTTVVAPSSAGLAGVLPVGFSGYETTLTLFSPFGLVALVSARRRKFMPRLYRSRGVRMIALAALLLSLAGCGGGHTEPFGNWTIVMTATTAGGGAPRNATINLTITP